MSDPIFEGYSTTDHSRLWEHLNRLAGETNDALAASAVVTNAFTASSGWSIPAQSLRRFFGGQLTLFTVSLTRTGPDIGVNAVTGNVTNTAVATWQTATYPCRYAPPPVSRNSRVASWIAEATGTLTLAAVAGSADIVTGDTFELGGFWL